MASKLPAIFMVDRTVNEVVYVMEHENGARSLLGSERINVEMDSSEIFRLEARPADEIAESGGPAFYWHDEPRSRQHSELLQYVMDLGS